MSLSLLYYNKDEAYVSCDSRVSFEYEEGKYCMLSDTGEKIHVIGDKLYFGSGAHQPVREIFALLKDGVGVVKAVETIRDKHMAIHGGTLPERYISILCAEYVKDKGVKIVFYDVEDGIHNIKMTDVNIKNKCDFGAVGWSVDPAMSMMPFFYQQSQNFEKMCDEVYYELSSVEIGGTMTIYHIDKQGVEEVLQKPIKDKGEILHLADTQKTHPKDAYYRGANAAFGNDPEDLNKISIFNVDGSWHSGHQVFSQAPTSCTNTGHFKTTNATITGNVTIGDGLNIGNKVSINGATGNMVANDATFNNVALNNISMGGTLSVYSDIARTNKVAGISGNYFYAKRIGDINSPNFYAMIGQGPNPQDGYGLFVTDADVDGDAFFKVWTTNAKGAVINANLGNMTLDAKGAMTLVTGHQRNINIDAQTSGADGWVNIHGGDVNIGGDNDVNINAGNNINLNANNGRLYLNGYELDFRQFMSTDGNAYYALSVVS